MKDRRRWKLSLSIRENICYIELEFYIEWNL